METSQAQDRHVTRTRRAAMIVLGLAVLLTRSATGDEPASFGDPLPGLTVSQIDQFLAGQDEFGQTEAPDEGLGPVFNNTSCVACHSSPAPGGDSDLGGRPLMPLMPPRHARNRATPTVEAQWMR